MDPRCGTTERMQGRGAGAGGRGERRGARGRGRRRGSPATMATAGRDTKA